MSFFDRIRSAFTRAPAALPPAKVVYLRDDGWAERGIGIAGANDRVSRATPTPIRNHTESTIDAIMASNGLAYRICSIEAEDAMREWFTIESLDDCAADELDAEWERLGAMDSIVQAAREANGYGGALLLLDIDDGQPIDMPINWTSLVRVRSIRVVNRWHAYPVAREVTPFGHGAPTMWRVDCGNGPVNVHAERVIMFSGPVQAENVKKTIDGYGVWGTSILDLCIDEIKGYQITVGVAANIVTALSQGVFKIKGLYSAILAGDQDAVKARVDALTYARGVLGDLAIDADGDDYQIVGRGATGVKDVMDAVSAGLVSATGIPRIKLFGESPQGLGAATGADGELRQWFDRVQSRRQSYYAPKLRKLARLILWSQMVPSYMPDPAARQRIVIDWPSLWQPTEQEAAATRLANAQARVADVTASVISTDEARRDPTIADIYQGINVAEPAPAAAPAGMVAPGEVEPPIAASPESAIPDGESLISLRDAGERLGVGPAAILSAARRGDIDAWRVGATWRVAWSQVATWAGGNRLASPPPPPNVSGPPEVTPS